MGKDHHNLYVLSTNERRVVFFLWLKKQFNGIESEPWSYFIMIYNDSKKLNSEI